MALAVTVVAAIGLALFTGLVHLVMPGYLPFNAMTTVWAAPHDGPAAEGGNDTWLVGDSVVRSRVDGATAYDVRFGSAAVAGRRETPVLPGADDPSGQERPASTARCCAARAP